MTENEERLSAQFDNAAIAALESLIEQLLPSDTKLLAHSHMQLGNIYDTLRKRAQREAHFRAAVEIAPTLQLASLGLFHTLYEQGRIEDALEEMLRLLRHRYSDMYAELLCEGFGSRFSIEQQNQIAEARRLLKWHRRN
jgi:tetratricopeptide (TPR) repeat protein